MSMHEASAGKFGLLSNQGISGSISLEALNTGSLTHTYVEVVTSPENLTRNEESWTLPESEFIRSPVDSEALW